MATDLTGKQKLFIEEYLQCWNATEAARRAGYKGTYFTLAGMGCENLKKPKIVKRIQERLQESAMLADEVLARLASQARGDIGDLLQSGGIIDLDEVKAAGLSHLIKSVTYQRGQRVRIELYSSQRALELIGKHHRLFAERYEHSGPDGGPIEVTLTEVVIEVPSDEPMEIGETAGADSTAPGPGESVAVG